MLSLNNPERLQNGIRIRLGTVTRKIFKMRRKERQITEINEIESIIQKADVCRIALADGTNPYLVTMNFGYAGGSEKRIFFHCASEGRKLDIIRKNNYACFEFDIGHNLYTGEKACDFGMNYESVVGWGNISIVTSRSEKITGLNQIMSHYTGKNDYSYDDDSILDRMLILRLDISTMTGKRCG